jgi:G3E family GTPase
VIETSGLADPAPILYTLGADPMLDTRLSLGRVVTVVDAANGIDTLARFAEGARQAAMADTLVISKTDLAPVLPALEDALAVLNPGAVRLLGQEIDDSGAVLFRHPGEGRGPGFSDWSSGKLDSGLRRNDEVEIAAVHSHGVDSFTLILSAPINRLDFARALGTLAAACGSDLLRVKGLVAFADRGGQPALVQAAQHTMFAPEWLDEWPDHDHRSRLVFVVHEVPRETVLASFDFAAPTVIGAPAHIHA